MLLLASVARVCRLATRTYYRCSVAGPRVPHSGPVLLVANHPNSLLDPAVVASVVDRPIRFLAKAPLFEDRLVGWLMRAAGAIPVYRRADDPGLMDRNEASFRSVVEALSAGAAVGIFPEGLSHSESSLAPIKTGAARIALRAAAASATAFPIVPLGLTLREKDRFRSEALILTGDPVPWRDLAGAGPDDADAVRELTRRLERALRQVTVNLQQWEDAVLVEAAEAIYATEYREKADPLSRFERLTEAAEILARLRAKDSPEWQAVAQQIRRHWRVLKALGVRPDDLHQRIPFRAAFRWTVRQLGFFLLAAPTAVVGTVFFWLPYRATGALAKRFAPSQSVRSTWKALAGTLLFVVWIMIWSAFAVATRGWVAGAAALVILPALALLTLHVRERWQEAVAAARRFLLLRDRTTLARRLRERQREIAGKLAAVRVARST